ncbi:MAG: hypothetical protein AB7T31_00605 [Gemmatimonadales bacterium]
MPLHDEYARVTPFEIAFPGVDRLEALAREVADESSRREVDPTELDAFLGLDAVGAFLGELAGEPPGSETPRVALLQYGSLVFHAVHFLGAGTPVFLLTTRVARDLVVGAPSGDPRPPTRAGYLQMPQHLFWTQVPNTPPESVDGAFWTVSKAERLYVLPVTGVRPERPGFGTLAVPDAPLAHATEWMDARVRDGGEDYASGLPGGELDRLYAIESAGEILKLMARFFAHATLAPADMVVPPSSGSAGGPRRSALAYTRVSPGPSARP